MCHRWFSSYCLIEENINLGYTDKITEDKTANDKTAKDKIAKDKTATGNGTK